MAGGSDAGMGDGEGVEKRPLGIFIPKTMISEKVAVVTRPDRATPVVTTTFQLPSELLVPGSLGVGGRAPGLSVQVDVVPANTGLGYVEGRKRFTPGRCDVAPLQSLAHMRLNPGWDGRVMQVALATKERGTYHGFGKSFTVGGWPTDCRLVVQVLFVRVPCAIVFRYIDGAVLKTLGVVRVTDPFDPHEGFHLVFNAVDAKGNLTHAELKDAHFGLVDVGAQEAEAIATSGIKPHPRTLLIGGLRNGTTIDCLVSAIGLSLALTSDNVRLFPLNCSRRHHTHGGAKVAAFGGAGGGGGGGGGEKEKEEEDKEEEEEEEDIGLSKRRREQNQRPAFLVTFDTPIGANTFATYGQGGLVREALLDAFPAFRNLIVLDDTAGNKNTYISRVY